MPTGIVFDDGTTLEQVKETVELHHGPIVPPPPPPPGEAYDPQLVKFDGNSWMMLDQLSMGLTDSASGIFAMTLKINGPVREHVIHASDLLTNNNDIFEVYLVANNGASHFHFNNDFGSLEVNYDPAKNSQPIDGTQHTLLRSWDLENDVRQLYINDTPVGFDTPQFDAEAMKWSQIRSMWIGSRPSPWLGKFSQHIGEIYLKVGEHLDMSLEENRRKMFNADGSMVWKGEHGELVTGHDANLLLSAEPANPHSFLTNRGMGGQTYALAGNIV